jgi:hypothetical protein
MEATPVGEPAGKTDHNHMKLTLLLCVAATLLLGACASHRGEIVTEVPSHDSVVRDQIPAEGSRKIPVIRQY